MEHVDAAGARIPALGFGTFELEPADAERMVHHALDVGYRHIDTAQMYGNEAAVGRAIAESGLDRGQLFVTTKVWMDRFRDGDLQRSVEESLGRLGLDQIDLVLLHWPNPDVRLDETIGALLDARERGLTAHVGVSNFPSALMHQAAELAGRGELVTNQVEYHPYLPQRAVMQAARELGMSVSAYCPLARGQVFDDPVLQRIGAAHGKGPGQVALRWLLDQGVIALPRTRTEAHADANLDVFDFALGDADRRAIETELPGPRRLIDPGFAPAWDAA
ncbi:MAG: aldo/keto reductase [Halofilum sp. (in: g-proteobacteria)]|nr:aldo/keto reductase [Halofilum sp. (in: g-proteobacteria)]